MFATRKTSLVGPEDALPGRAQPIPTGDTHAVNGAALRGPYPEGAEIADFGLGCFWGAERLFWQMEGVLVTAVGYQGGHTPNPTYEEVCSGRTAHAEVVRVFFDPSKVSYDTLLKAFFEAHDPTQGMRQGNDVGSQYRSAIFTHGDDQARMAAGMRQSYQAALRARGGETITTEIRPAPEFYFAESAHQQYLHKNPGGYCGLRGTGVVCPLPERQGAGA